MGEQVERVLIDLSAEDNASLAVQRVRQRVVGLGKDFDKAKKEALQFNKALDQESKEFEQLFNFAKKLEAQRDKEIADQKKIVAGIKATNDARREGVSRARAVGQIGREARQISGALGGVGAIGGPQVAQIANVAPQVLQTVESIGLLKEQLPLLTTTLTASAGGAGVAVVALGFMAAAIAGLVIAFKIFQNIVDDTKKATESLIDVNKRYAEVIATSTTDEVEAAITANEERNKILAQEREQLRGFIDATEDIDGAAGAFLDLNDALNTNLGGMEDVQDQLDAVNKELGDNVNLNEQLSSALSRGATAARDAIAAEQALADERETQVAQRISNIRKLSEIEAETQRRLATFTDAQQQARVDEIDILIEQEKRIQEANALARERGAIEGKVAIDQFNNSLARIGQLEKERELLETTIKAAIDAREREAATIKLVETNISLTRKAYEDAIKSQADFAGALDEANAEKLQAEQDFADKTVEIESKRQLDIIQDAEKAALDRTNDLADHYKDLADLDRDFFEERGDLLDDISADIAAVDDEKLSALKEFNKVEIRSTVDHLKRLEAIRLRAQNSIRSASAQLDALGIFEAKEAAKQELKNEKDKFDEDKKRRQEDFDDLKDGIFKERGETLRAGRQALDDLKAQHRKEEQSAKAAFNEKLRREDQQAALEARQQQQRWDAEDQKRQTQFDNEADDRAEHFSLLLTLTSNGLFQIELAYQAWLDSVALRTATTLQTPVGAPAANLPTGNLPAFSSPAAITNGPQGVSNFRQPSQSSPTGDAGPLAAAGATIMINIDGTREPIQVGAEVVRKLTSVFGDIAQ